MSDDGAFSFSGKAQVWIWPTPREGELVPDHPPTDLGEYIMDVTLEEAGPDEDQS